MPFEDSATVEGQLLPRTESASAPRGRSLPSQVQQTSRPSQAGRSRFLQESNFGGSSEFVSLKNIKYHPDSQDAGGLAGAHCHPLLQLHCAALVPLLGTRS